MTTARRTTASDEAVSEGTTPEGAGSVRDAAEEAAYCTAQSVFSDPGAMAPCYEGLPADPVRLARVVRDLMVHRTEGEVFGCDIPEDRLHDDAETRYVDDILRIVAARDPAPLERRRALADRFVGICRDFALLHCSMLRHVGIPARTRSGFANYFDAERYHYDHMVTEYLDTATGRWVLVDPQLMDPAAVRDRPVDFDPADVPRDRFLVAGAAWRAIREGEAEAGRFGLYAGSPFSGEVFVAGNVRLDLAALNRTETLLWDTWGWSAGHGDGLTDEQRAVYDTAAAVTAGGPDGTVDLAAVRRLFAQSDALRTPRSVRCMAPCNGPSDVTLRAEEDAPA